MCAETIGRRAVRLGYDLTLATDAHPSTGTEILSAANVVAHHNDLLDDFGNDEHEVTTVLASAVTFWDTPRVASAT